MSSLHGRITCIASPDVMAGATARHAPSGHLQRGAPQEGVAGEQGRLYPVCMATADPAGGEGMAGLRDDQDAFGHLLDDCLHGRDGLELVERDDGLLGSAGSARRYFAPFEEWPPHEQAAMSWARGRVLDIGCGAGRHALHLQELGFRVTGIDISPRSIAVCRQRGLRDARVLDVEHPGIAWTDADGRWDTVLLLGANVGLLGGAAEGRALLARLAGITGTAARIIAESRDPGAGATPGHAAYLEANRRRGLLPGRLRLRIRYKDYATPWFSYLFVGKAELESILDDTGWRVVQYLDSESEPGAYIALIEKDPHGAG